ncbi:MAG: hypothetical protein V4440_06890 [Pseudomonadota bacterium]
MIGNTTSAFAILIGLLLSAVAYLAVRYFYFGFEFEEIPINKRRLFDKHQLIKKVCALIPILGYFTYLLIQNRMELVESTILLAAPVLFLLVHEFLFFQPHLDSLSDQAEKLFIALEMSNEDAKYNFQAKNAAILLKWDLPEYRFSSLSSIKMDRVCKNDLGEYFSVIASTNEYSQPKIKHISVDAAKRLLSKDREVFVQEFNEEPYYKSK